MEDSIIIQFRKALTDMMRAQGCDCNPEIKFGDEERVTENWYTSTASVIHTEECEMSKSMRAVWN